MNDRSQRCNSVIDLLSDPSGLGIIPALRVAAPCSPLRDPLLLLFVQKVGFLLQVRVRSLDGV